VGPPHFTGHFLFNSPTSSGQLQRCGFIRDEDLSSMKRRVPWMAFVILAVVISSRILIVGDVRMDHDEVRSISRTFGTPAQIIDWQPLDWPPLYYLLLGAYRMAVGFHPLVMRFSSVLLFAVSLAGMYPLGMRLFRRRQAALAGMAAYATVGLVLFQSVHVRGYVLGLALYPIAFWLSLRFFETENPRWRWAVPLALTLAALFYTTYSVVPGYVLLLLFTLIAYPARRIWRWGRPAVIAILAAAPQMWKLASHIIPTLVRREEARAAGTQFTSEPYRTYQFVLLRNYAGGALPLWVALLLLTIVVLIYFERPLKRTTTALLICAAAGPVFAAAILPFFGIAEPHYSWWAVFPFVLLAGRSLSYLPRRVWMGALLVLLVVPFLPLPTDQFRYGNSFQTPFEDTFGWLEARIEPGDVIFLDPSCTTRADKCGRPEEWDYYQMVYFPDRRLHIVSNIDETANVRRVWYVHVDGWQDKTLEARVATGRLKSQFVGPWDFLWQLYEAPPDSVGVLYDNGMRFHGFDIIDPRLRNGYAEGPVVRREGEQVILRLWWSVDKPLTNDYSVSTLIATAPDAPPLAQFDGPPQTISLFPYDSAPPMETSLWQPGQFYVEERVIRLPMEIDSALRGTPLGIYMTLYQWWDGATIDAPGVYETGRRKLREMFVLTY
jgi:hypothetical protein